jgi:sterol 3beta-glucosyltransferase
MVLEIYGRRDLSLDFYKRSSRDAAIERVLDSVRKVQDEAKANVSTSEPSSPVSPIEDPLSSASSSPPSHNRLSSLLSASRTSSRLVVPARIVPYVPRAMNVPRAQLPHIAPRHFVCLTIGSRGDVQPYIALAVGLMKEGHRVTIVTHEEYKAWIESWGVGHRRTGGDPAALMKLSVEHKMFSPQFFKESLGKVGYLSCIDLSCR